MIIDIRSREEYNKGHIEQAICIPYQELVLYSKKYLDKNKNYKLYCNSGKKSNKLVEYLKGLGYKVENIEGGYIEYLFRK